MMMHVMQLCAPELPRFFCWTRFGTEAGEPIDAILERKEAERRANDGVFLWGIGNSIAPALEELLAREPAPEVLFSPIRSAPNASDVDPPAVASWKAGRGMGGEAFALPEHSTVTSRYDPARPAQRHYALVCASPAPLLVHAEATLTFAQLRNLRSGAPLGFSQVTAVVSREDGEDGEDEYPVAFRAALVAPYFVSLHEPRQLSGRRGRALGARAG
jgi:hypothetical protein